jgi:hypothetical protein
VIIIKHIFLSGPNGNLELFRLIGLVDSTREIPEIGGVFSEGLVVSIAAVNFFFQQFVFLLVVFQFLFKQSRGILPVVDR